MAHSPRNIAHCIHGLGLGGAQKVVASIVRSSTRGEFRHFVFSCHGGVLREEVENAGAEVRIVERRIAKLDPIWVHGLARAMRQERIDIVHTHLFGDSLHGYLAARRAGELPVVMTLHNVLDSFSTLQRFGYRWLLRRPLRAVACSESVHDSFRVLQNGTSSLVTIRNGIDAASSQKLPARERAEIRCRFGAGEDSVLLVTVGRLVEQKGHSYLLEAFGRLRRELDVDVRLVFLGDGPLGPELERQAEVEGVRDRVVFAGFVEGVPALLPAVDGIVFSSLHEGLPVALLEAMAAGKGIVCTALPSFLEATENEREALIVPARDSERLAGALARFASDPRLRTRLGAAALQRFEEHFSAEGMVHSYETLYRELGSRDSSAA